MKHDEIYTLITEAREANVRFFKGQIDSLPEIATSIVDDTAQDIIFNHCGPPLNLDIYVRAEGPRVLLYATDPNGFDGPIAAYTVYKRAPQVPRSALPEIKTYAKWRDHQILSSIEAALLSTISTTIRRLDGELDPIRNLAEANDETIEAVKTALKDAPNARLTDDGHHVKMTIQNYNPKHTKTHLESHSDHLALIAPLASLTKTIETALLQYIASYVTYPDTQQD